jgi:hypothetical protein
MVLPIDLTEVVHYFLHVFRLLPPVVPVSLCYCPLLWQQVSTSGFGGLVVSMLASGTQVRGFKPEKIPSMPSFGGEVKPSVPYHSFAAC